MSGVPDRAELLELLGESARGGSVAAMKTLLEELRRDDDDSDGGFAELDATSNVTPLRRRAG